MPLNFIGAYKDFRSVCIERGMLWDSIIIIVARRVVRKLFKRFPLFQGNTDMLDNVMDFSPRDKNKLIFSSSTTTIQDSLSIYKWVHIGAKKNMKCLKNLKLYYQRFHFFDNETVYGFPYILLFELKL